MDINAVVNGEVLKIDSLILEQYILQKLWEYIMDICFDSPLRQAKEVKFKVMLPWETSYIDLQLDSYLQGAFKKLREKAYRWAFFIVSTELDHASNTCKQGTEVVIVTKDKTLVSPEDQIPVHLDYQVELE